MQDRRMSDAADFQAPISREIWDLKYRLKGPNGPIDSSLDDTFWRVFLPPFSAAAAARATRQNVSSSDESESPPSTFFRRYLMSHISREMGAENSASSRIGASCSSARKYGVEAAQSQ